MDQRRLQLAINNSQLVERAVRTCAPSMPRHLDLVELSVRGRLGLLAAAEDFDLDGDTPFAEFALARIRDEVEHAVTDDPAGLPDGCLADLRVTGQSATLESDRRDHRVG